MYKMLTVENRYVAPKKCKCVHTKVLICWTFQERQYFLWKREMGFSLDTDDNLITEDIEPGKKSILTARETAWTKNWLLNCQNSCRTQHQASPRSFHSKEKSAHAVHVLHHLKEKKLVSKKYMEFSLFSL